MSVGRFRRNRHLKRVLNGNHFHQGTADVGVTPFSAAQKKGKGWLDVADSPVKHPGPWLTIKDTPEQLKLRKELAGVGKIAFASNRDGNWEIYVTNPDGSGQKNLTNQSGWDIYPRWTPDGKILFFSDRDAKMKMSQITNQLIEGVVQVGPWALFR
jgi:hypothetical protein